MKVRLIIIVLAFFRVCQYVQCALVTFTAGPDFTPLSITVTLEIDATHICYDIETTDDDIVEPIELFEVVLSNAERISIGSPSSLMIRIRDDGDSKCNNNITIIL